LEGSEIVCIFATERGGERSLHVGRDDKKGPFEMTSGSTKKEILNEKIFKRY
jgi:hypothetical protein